MRAILAGLALALSSVPAFAQTVEDDWDLAEDPVAGTLAAAVTYATGDTLMVTCQGGRLDLFLATRAVVPAARPAEMQFDDHEPEFQTWLSTANPAVVMSGLPAPNARRLRASRMLTVVFRPDAGSTEVPQRHVLDLPATAVGVDRVLDACSQSRTDPRDSLGIWNVGELPPPANGWARLPQVEYPRAAQTTGIENGLAVLSCIVGPGGAPRDCRVEKEINPKGEFGIAALSALRSARVRTTGDGAAVEGQLFFFTTRFRLQ